MPRNSTNAAHVEPAPGQHWSLIAIGSGRYEVVIDRIEADAAGRPMAIVKSVKSGKELLPVRVKTLRQGMRGARLLRHADGSEPTKISPEPPKPEPVFVRHERVYAPRGATKRTELTEQEEKILKLRGEGLTRTEVGRLLGLNESQVATREQNARDILALRRLKAS